MGLGEKKKHTGFVKLETVNKGSKSEHDAIVLDTGNGPALELQLLGGNPFHEPSLDRFVGMRVTVDGIEGSGRAAIFIEKLSDITVLGPPGRPRRPPAP